MAELARETGLVVHHVMPRSAGVIARARELAEQGGLRVTADVLEHTIRVRFEP